MDLLDELGTTESNNAAQGVRNLGGDLLDEAGIKTNDSSLLSPRVTQRQATPDVTAELDRINESLSMMDKFLIGAGRGMMTIARGVGLADPEDPTVTKAFNRLTDDSTTAQIGEVIGEAAPFLAAAPLSGVGLATGAGRALIPAAKSTAARVVGAAGLGAAEGSLINRGRGGDTVDQVAGGVIGGTLAGTIEAISPIIGRMGGALFRRLGRKPKGDLLTPNGQPTPEFKQVLEETGTSFKDLTDEAFSLVNKSGVDPKQAARAARFESLGIPATRGDISQEFADQAMEQRLLSQAGAEAGEPLRQLKLDQSQKFIEKTRELIDRLGVPDNVGESVKDALSGRKSLLKAEKNALYKKVAENAPDVPIVPDDIADAVLPKKDMRRLSRLAPSQVGAVDDLLVEFGVNNSPEAVEQFVKSGGEITPLSLANAEDFRQALGVIERSSLDNKDAILNVTGPIKNALDKELELIDEAIIPNQGMDKALLDTLKQARQRVRTLKTEFSPQAVVGQLTGVKKDGVTPIIEASKVARKLLNPQPGMGAPIENLERVLTSLKRSGKPGQRAIKDLQASVILNALEAGLKAPSQKTSGMQTVGGLNFAKELSKFGDAKLDLLFRGSPKALARLRNLKQTALDINPSAASTPKGSAPVILDILNRTGQLPGLAAMRDMVNLIVKAGADERAVRKAMDSKPAFRKAALALRSDFPALASTLGVAAVASVGQDKQQGGE